MSKGSVITVGNFDGVHVGHQALLRQAKTLAQQSGSEVIAITFDQHPLSLLRPKSAPPMLTHRSQSIDSLKQFGADQVYQLELNVELLKQSPHEFVEMIVDQFKPVAWVEGVNFRFGRHRKGTPQTLQTLGAKIGFDVKVLDLLTVTLRDKTLINVSSSLVRWLVYHGRMADVQLCLGRPFALRGKVIAGDKRGRTIGFPTANLDCSPQMLPAQGVYAGHCQINGQTYTAAVSIGVKPTFHGHEITCEAYLLDFDGDLYNQVLEVQLLRWIRDQQVFAHVEQLVEQLDRDVQLIRQLEVNDLLDVSKNILIEV